MTMRTMRFFAAMSLLLFAGTSYSCVIPAPGTYDEPEELIESTDTIVLAVAVSAVPGGWNKMSIVTFTPIRFLKGAHEGPIEILGQSVLDDSPDPNDFDKHRDPEFWDRGGNGGSPGDCQVYGLFHLGQNYLLFLRPQGSYRSFENIQSDDDQWLEFVEATIASE